jgi:hypothetical protein
MLTAPPTITSKTSASFSWSGEAGAIYKCGVDSATLSTCSATKLITGLTEGSHTFTVQQIDRAGNVGATQTTSWIVDLTAPVAPIITDSPANTSALKTPSFSFDNQGETISEFRCAMDSNRYSAAKTCSSPYTQSSALKTGIHNFYVWQVDPASNVSPPVKYTWTVTA